MLDVLALYRRSDILMMLSVDEALQTVPVGEAQDCPDTMFPCSARKVAGDADVEGAVGAVRYDVNPSSSYGTIVRMPQPERNRGKDRRVTPGHDGEGA